MKWLNNDKKVEQDTSLSGREAVPDLPTNRSKVPVGSTWPGRPGPPWVLKPDNSSATLFKAIILCTLSLRTIAGFVRCLPLIDSIVFSKEPASGLPSFTAQQAVRGEWEVQNTAQGVGKTQQLVQQLLRLRGRGRWREGFLSELPLWSPGMTSLGGQRSLPAGDQPSWARV